jgi:hypothetical protein
MFRHLGLEYLVQDGFQQLLEAVIPGEQTCNLILTQLNLKVGHRFSSFYVLVGTNDVAESGGLFNQAPSEFTALYGHNLLDRNLTIIKGMA